MPVRIWIALVALCLAVLGSTLDLPSPQPDAYKVDDQMERFRPLIADMPRVASAGYISDLPLTSTGGSAAFFTAQYAIAPVLIEDESKKQHEWAVGNFSKPVDFAALGRPLGLTVFKDFGNGVILFRRAAK